MAIGMTAIGFFILLFTVKPQKPESKAPIAGTPDRLNQTSDADTRQQSLTQQFFVMLLKRPDAGQTHQKKLAEAFRSNWQDYLDDPALFPRQPMILPKLLQAMKAETSNNQALLDIVLEDPGLTTEVLRLANSPIYRNTNKEIQSVDYALVMLGVDGLHSLVCSSLMKPIFAKRRGDGFSASLFWDWALASSQSSQHFAALNQVKEPTQVYMLSLLTRLSELVIMRLCTRLSEKVGAANSADSVLPIIEQYRYLVTAKLIDEWGFDSGWKRLLPTENELDKTSPSNQIYRAQGLSIEFGSASILINKQLITESDALLRLQSLGVAQITGRNLINQLKPAD